LLFNAVSDSKPSKPAFSWNFNQIQKLNFLDSVLYIAAHDDENTSLISYLANEKKRTGYLSLTRDDGGQNWLSVTGALLELKNYWS
jgi:hypothetical protein